MSHRPVRCTLTGEQLALCRSRLEDWASLTEAERDSFLNDTVRDAWLLENPNYNWSDLGVPEDDGVTTYYWTYNVSSRTNTRQAMYKARRCEPWGGRAHPGHIPGAPGAPGAPRAIYVK